MGFARNAWGHGWCPWHGCRHSTWQGRGRGQVFLRFPGCWRNFPGRQMLTFNCKRNYVYLHVQMYESALLDWDHRAHTMTRTLMRRVGAGATAMPSPSPSSLPLCLASDRPSESTCLRRLRQLLRCTGTSVIAGLGVCVLRCAADDHLTLFFPGAVSSSVDSSS